MALYDVDLGYRKDRSKRLHFISLLSLVFVVLGGYLTYQSPKSSSETSTPVSAQTPALPTSTKITDPLPWPVYGQSAYGVVDKGVLAVSQNDAQPVPIASLAKVITALAVLKQKPLNPGEQGPMLTLSQQDIESYEEYVRKSGAVVPVEVGGQISQQQALQAMLMPSANNMSDTLARWAFGSMEEYTKYANTMINELGLAKTVVADASGFSPRTVSTADEVTQLGILYMKNPVLREIATQPEANIPFAGLIKNYNAEVNKDGITGIKVGNTDEAGRCFLVADIRGEVVAVTAVIGAESLETAMKDAITILKAGNTSYDRLP